MSVCLKRPTHSSRFTPAKAREPSIESIQCIKRESESQIKSVGTRAAAEPSQLIPFTALLKKRAKSNNFLSIRRAIAYFKMMTGYRDSVLVAVNGRCLRG